MASNKKGITGENLLQILESRLDNVVYKLGFASSRPQARQLVNHGHFDVNGKKVDIASYQVKPGDVISVRENKRDTAIVKENLEANAAKPVPAWLEKDAENLSGKVIRLAAREDIDLAVEEHLIVELYSKYRLGLRGWKIRILQLLGISNLNNFLNKVGMKFK